MSSADVERLRAIKTFPSLVKYLRDELDWPIETDDVEELTFEYDPEELGIDLKTAAKIQEIKQLRPLSRNQPWGIFFVKFEPKRLPVVVLRRILSQLVVKKRASISKAKQAVWHLHDLLFISNYGEGTDRQITFAHFTESAEGDDLPTLRVLGWDDQETQLHMEYAARTLRQNFHWPGNEANTDAWRDSWSAAFAYRHREAINTAMDLADRLAGLAIRIRSRVNQAMAVETEKGPIRRLYKGFQQALIHDLTEADFADMYAQTITYGLLAARVSRPMGIIADNLHELIPVTNPFLKEMLESFMKVGGRAKGGLDFDELGVQEVVAVLNDPDTHIEAVLREFNNKDRQEDPVIHFYEDFLSAYDKAQKKQRGVFYTPQPVVSYIVRSVHELLQTEFGLEDGLASIATWAEMGKSYKELKVPVGIDPHSAFVQILDPATGTGTFLVEVIEVIHQTLQAKWTRMRLTASQQQAAWNEYVPKQLLPRLHGYELMMAPYAIAHLKIGLKLYETGYRFNSPERARIFLTNALEPASETGHMRLDGILPALAHEAEAVDKIKRQKRFTVVIGNPPYAAISSNLTPELRRIVDPFRFVNGEKIHERSMLQFEKNIQDDYIKFLAFAQARLIYAGVGVGMFITNHSYLDGPTLRGVRWNLLTNFPNSWFLDLHGNSNKGEELPEGSSANENVFDIKQGVSVAALLRAPASKKASTHIGDCWGTRTEKYNFLSSQTLGSTPFREITPKVPYYFFVLPDNGEGAAEWDSWPSVADIFKKRSTGTESGFDELMVAFTREELESGVRRFSDPAITRTDLLREIKISDGHASELFSRRRELASATSKELRPFQLRAYDYRFAFLRRELLKTNSFNVMLDLSTQTPGLVTTRQTKENFTAFAVNSFCGHKVTSSYDRSYVFPLFSFDQGSLFSTKGPCIDEKVLSHFKRLSGQSDDLKVANEIFRYALAIFNAPTYGTMFRSQLKRDFPHLPLTQNRELFRGLSSLGDELVSLQLMDSSKLAHSRTEFIGNRQMAIDKVSWSKSTVWVDKDKTTGFRGVPENVWNLHVGGYQVCEKWLKDRKGRTLSKDDIAHYHKIVVALFETIRLMAEIDKVVECHGGWPGAFHGKS